MTLEVQNKVFFIEFFRKNGFNCFPIPENQKTPDHRYQASRTKLNQVILDNENYGVIAIENSGNAIVDLDNKELYRPFAEQVIKQGYMIIETPHGWHIPITNLSGNIQKVKLYDYKIQPDKQIIEIQGYDHCCVGVGSQVMDKNGQVGIYQNRGTEKIFDAKEKDFHDFIDFICKTCNVISQERERGSSYSLRERFLNGKPPTKGTSNDYFFQASLQCNTDGLTKDEATEKIKDVYDKWILTDAYSNRPWSGIEAKIDDVYGNNYKLKIGRPQGNTSTLDRTVIAQSMIDSRKLYSNVDTKEIFENTDGFLERINATLQRELQNKYPQMESTDYNSILFKLVGLAEPIPKTNKTLKVFKNGTYSIIDHRLIETEEIADMGFKNYNYLEPTKENEPTKFIEIMFNNYPIEEHPRIKAGLKSALSCYLDPRISFTYGLSRVGKSVGLEILVMILGEYSLAVTLDQFLTDHFIRAQIIGKTFLYIQDSPEEWKNFEKIKTTTGEQRKLERGFMQDAQSFDNKLKIWVTGNYVPKIPENEKNSMYSSRLSLIHNSRTIPYPEDPTLIDRIVEDEGEKIISWILNIPDEECAYEDSLTVRKEWEKLASPEIAYLEENYEISDPEPSISVMKIKKDFDNTTKITISLESMKKALESQGYVIKNNMISNIRVKQKNKEVTSF